VLDIETASLSVTKGGAGFLCAVIKPLDSKSIFVWRHDVMSPRGAIRQTLKTLADFDLVIGHNVQRFDLNMLFSYACIHSIPFGLNPLVYDTLTAFGRVGYCTTLTPKGNRRKSLGFAIDFFWPSENDKTSLYPNWHSIASYDKGEAGNHAMAYVVEHCIADVMLTEKLYWRILPDDRNARINRWR